MSSKRLRNVEPDFIAPIRKRLGRRSIFTSLYLSQYGRCAEAFYTRFSIDAQFRQIQSTLTIPSCSGYWPNRSTLQFQRVGAIPVKIGERQLYALNKEYLQYVGASKIHIGMNSLKGQLNPVAQLEH